MSPVTIHYNHPSTEPEPTCDQKLQSLPPQSLNKVITMCVSVLQLAVIAKHI